MPHQHANVAFDRQQIDTAPTHSAVRAASIDEPAAITARIQAAIDAARAKPLRPPTTRENAALVAHRSTTARILSRVLSQMPAHRLAAACAVTRTVVVRWLDARWSDKRPAPMAMLLAIGDEDFEAVVAALRKARGEG